MYNFKRNEILYEIYLKTRSEKFVLSRFKMKSDKLKTIQNKYPYNDKRRQTMQIIHPNKDVVYSKALQKTTIL